MTERLYYHDSFLTEFDARVLTCTQSGDRHCVLLDRMASFNTSTGYKYLELGQHALEVR